jgi:TRAP transporter TAXI family solute receptor
MVMKRACFGYFLVSLAVIFSLLSCVKKDDSKKAASETPTKFISIASSESGSFQYMYMSAYAGYLRRYLPNINLTNEATNGTSENIDLLYRGEVGIGLASPERLYNAYEGIDAYQEKGKLRVGILWCYMQQSALLIVKKNSGIEGFRDLTGKKVCIGAAGSSNELKNAYILDAYGYTRKDPKTFEYKELQTLSITYNEGANALSEGTVDAIVLTRPLPEPAIYELALVTPLDVIPLDQDMFDKILKIYPWMWEGRVPTEVYPGQEEMLTLGDPNYVLASLDTISEEEAYNMTKAYVEQILPQMVQQFDPIKPYGIDKSLLLSNWVIPGHPGAVKYFEEQGYKVNVISAN